MARPKKSEGERFHYATVRFPPDDWEQLAELVPERRRSAVIQWGLRRELDWLKREAKRRGMEVGDLVISLVRDEQRQRQIDRLKSAREPAAPEPPS